MFSREPYSWTALGCLNLKVTCLHFQFLAMCSWHLFSLQMPLCFAQLRKTFTCVTLSSLGNTLS